mmetsp:Transcript_28563/g.53719  ORF Transcript_28563/g.53719 Transcript_28563/m.53719 type:complete len:215 (-) Transcript_28563:2177-2821(-)
MTTRQLFSIRGHFAGQFAIGNHGASESHGTNPDTQAQLHQQNADLHTGLLGDQLAKGAKLFHSIRTRGHSFRCVANLKMRVKAHKHRRQTNQRVHASHKFRHLGHFDFRRQLIADHATRRDQRNGQPPQARTGADQCGKHRQRHAGNAVPHRALGAFLIVQPSQGEDEEHCRNNVCCGCKTVFHRSTSLGLLEHGEHAPCHEETAEDVDPGHEY